MFSRQESQVNPSQFHSCKHAANGMCDYCMPMEPYDSRYLEQNKIKHMSFHAYLRQLNAAHKGKELQAAGAVRIAPLEEPNYKVKVPCKGGHAPWPEGICTKCQPSAVTLQSQVRFGYAYGRAMRWIFDPESLFRLRNKWRASNSPKLTITLGLPYGGLH